MTDKDEPIDGEDYFSDFYSISDTEDPEFGLKQVKKMIKGILDGGYIATFNDIIRIFNTIIMTLF